MILRKGEGLYRSKRGLDRDRSARGTRAERAHELLLLLLKHLLHTMRLLLGVALVCTATAMPKHIVHIIADDLGWAGVSWHRNASNAAVASDIRTPRLHALLSESLDLDRFYTYNICSPSRCAIQTGRNPVHVNVVNVPPESVNPQDAIGGWQGIPVNMSTVANKLQGAGWATHLVGKWDIGMATEQHHPRARGYDSWFGYWHHSNDYYQQTVETCKLKKIKDLWRYNSSVDGPARGDANAADCTATHQNTSGDGRCVFEEQLLSAEAQRIVRAHNRSRSLYLMYSMHLVHMPLQIPAAVEAEFAFIDDEYRRKNHAMVSFLDGEVGALVDTLKETGLWNDTLLVFHADNGGEIMGAGTCGGNNWPLRGGKFSNWEGGIRVVGLVSGGALPAARRGTKTSALVTSWDWYATYCTIAGADPADSKAAAAKLPPVDSISQWGFLSGANATQPRAEIFIADGPPTLPDPNADGEARCGGLIRGRYKLLLGRPPTYWVSQDVLTMPRWPNTSSHIVPLSQSRHCGRKPNAHGCLFDLQTDPTESRSVASEQPALFERMLAAVDAASATAYSPDRGKPDPRACAQAIARGGYWGPFASAKSDDEGGGGSGRRQLRSAWLPIEYKTVSGQGFDHHQGGSSTPFAAAECSKDGGTVTLRGYAECDENVVSCFTSQGATAGGIVWGTLPPDCRPHSTTLTSVVLVAPGINGVPCGNVDFHVSKDGSIVLTKPLVSGCWQINLDGASFDGSKPDDWAWVSVAVLLFCGVAWLFVGVGATVKQTEGMDWRSWDWRKPFELHPHREKVSELQSLVKDGTRLSLQAISARGVPLGPLERMLIGEYDAVGAGTSGVAVAAPEEAEGSGTESE